MICPVCKYDMLVVEYHDIELDYCSSCKGVWFDAGELELLLESHSFEQTKALLDGILNSEEAISSEKKRNCPICGHKMKKTAIGEQPGLLIDICRDEHGLWFDGGEVTQLMRHLAEKHLPKHDSRQQVISFLEEVFEAPEQTRDA
ncbi:MAG: zf-TFIIB domain-containing protein [Dehalococcoidia bacterium]|jgi:Zn-finger nucleic acid-binding protein